MRPSLILIIVLILMGCEADKIGPQSTGKPTTGHIAGRKIYLVNEGNFGRGGSGISAYTPKDKHHYDDVFTGANHGALIGDVAQQMILFGGHYYVVVNGSAYIAIMDTTNLLLTDSITGQMKAPKALAIAQDKIFIGDLFSSRLWVAGLNDHQINSHIILPSPASDLLVWNQKLAVTAAHKLVIIDLVSEQVDTIIEFQQGLAGLGRVSDSSLWVLTAGANGGTGALYQLNAQLSIMRSLYLPSGNPGKLSANRQMNLLYWVMDDAVHVMHKDSTGFKRLMDLTTQNLYGFDIDPLSGDLYLSDALDFDQPSDIYRFNAEGQLLDQFKSGINTAGFCFAR